MDLPWALVAMVLFAVTLGGGAFASPRRQTGVPPPPVVSKVVSDFLASIPNDDERTETVVTEFPWAVLVGTKVKDGGKGLRCYRNGVLISNRYVLTSASAARFCKGSLTVHLGGHDYNSDKDCSTLSGKEVCAPPVVDVPVAEVIVHPEFKADGSKPTCVRHDIALIRLAQEVAFTDFVRPLSLPPHKADSTDNGGIGVGSWLTAVGWGRTSDNATNSLGSSSLTQLPTKALPLGRCDKKDSTTDAETDLCVASISPKEGYGICRMWGGNALIGWRDTVARSQILGLDSCRFCNQDNQRVLYVRVAPYVPWILDTMHPTKSSSVLAPRAGTETVKNFLASIPNDDERTETVVAEFPWAAVLVGSKDKDGSKGQGCIQNGVLISSRYVLTSAIAARECKGSLTVRLGEHDSESDEDCSTVSGKEVCAPPAIEVPVAEVIEHPEYETDVKKRTWLWHNIALIRLAREVAFNDFVRPLSLPPHKDTSTDDGSTAVGSWLTVVGWGRTNDTYSNNSDHPTLIQLPTKALPLSRCESKGYPANVETDVCVASISPKEGYGICRPWGGNALIGWRDTPARSQLLGLESGFFCVQSNQRKIYLRVAPYVPWILNTMKPKSSSSVLPAPAVSKAVSDLLASIPNDHERTETVVAEFPWIARVGKQDKSGGKTLHGGHNAVLISSRYVLTKAGQLTNADDMLAVHLGEHNYNSDVDCSTLSGKEVCAPPFVEMPVAEVIVHPEYEPKSLRNDIALVRLAQEVAFNDFVRPLGLPPREDNSTDGGSSEVGKRLTAVGWAKNTDDSTHVVWGPTLAQLPTSVLPLGLCKSSTDPPANAETNICVASASHKKGNGICRLSVGESVLIASGRRDTLARSQLVGLSSNILCEQDNQRGIYSRVAPYVPWILDTMKPNPSSVLPPPGVSKAVSDFLASTPEDDKRTETVVAEFPWAVMVGRKKESSKGFSCFHNGVLIGSRFVLTSAVATRDCNDPLTVRLGEHDSESDKDCFTLSGKEVCAPSVVEVPVAEVTVHPEFEPDRSKRTWLWHNIALIRLAREVEFNDFVRPLSLPPLKDNSTDGGSTAVGTRLTIVGWGRTNDTYSNTFVYSSLAQLPAKVWPMARCETKDYPANAETDLCITSISRQEGFGACRVWDGAALIGSSGRESQLRQYLLGLSSSTICSDDVQKVTYLRVAPYVPWILDSVRSGASSDSL